MTVEEQENLEAVTEINVVRATLIGGLIQARSTATTYAYYNGTDTDTSEFNSNRFFQHILTMNNGFLATTEVETFDVNNIGFTIVFDHTSSDETLIDTIYEVNPGFISQLNILVDANQGVEFHPVYMTQWVSPVSEKTFLSHRKKRLSDYDASLIDEELLGGGTVEYEVPVRYGVFVRIISLSLTSSFTVSELENAPSGISILNMGYSVGGVVQFLEATEMTIKFSSGQTLILTLKPYFFERVDVT